VYTLTNNSLYQGSPIFALGSTNAGLTLLQTITFGPGVPARIIDGRQAKAAYYLNVSVCDTTPSPFLCNYAALAVYVTPNLTQALTPLVQGISAAPSPTLGGGVVSFLGLNFVIGQPANATYTNPDGVNYTAACNIQDIFTVVCITVPGYGSILTW
jgi:hypothetical protein